jgi:SprT-like family
VTHSPKVRISQSRARQQEIQCSILKLVPHSSPQKIQLLLNKLQQASEQIERSFQQQGLSAAQLSDPSRQLLAWIKFLLQGQNLEAHLETIRRLQKCCRDLSPRRGLLQPSDAVDPKRLTIELGNFKTLYRCQRIGDSALLQASEGFIAGDDSVLQALAKTILFGKSSDPTRILKRFSVSEEYREVLLALDLMVDPLADRSQGQVYNLEELFNRVNQQYFQNKIRQPNLTWSKSLTRRKFGHYEPARNCIMLSLTLDSKQVPVYTAEFVLYHEMLHIQHGETWVNGRRMVHTPAFRKDERKFQHYQSAEAELARLARSYGEALKD